jgi:hypothetical protein
MMRRASMAVAAAVIGLASGASARAGDGPGVEAKAAFAKLKTLAGEWTAEATEGGHGGDHEKVVYKVTANGSAIMQNQFPGSDHEMISMYHLDGDDLRMTHYCAAGNQPRMKLDRKASTPDVLVFVFDGGTNLDPAKDMHIHGLKTTFKPGGRIEEAWDGYAGGKLAATTTFVLTKPKK